MFQHLTKFAGAALAGLALTFPAFAADRPMQKERPAANTGKAEAYVEDSVITAKVKAALLRAPELKSRDVEVETDHGRVMLTGVVRSKAEREHALKTAAGVDGVTDVKDALVVR
jgi:hyperosmotically inducible periplasmic protein